MLGEGRLAGAGAELICGREAKKGSREEAGGAAEEEEAPETGAGAGAGAEVEAGAFAFAFAFAAAVEEGMGPPKSPRERFEN